MNQLHAPHTHYICTAEQSRQLDRDTIERFGIDGFTLMEVAGHCAAEKLLEKLPSKSGCRGLYLCGKGNNAGDALVVARYLIQHGHPATLLFLSGTGELSPDTNKNLELLNTVSREDPSAAEVTIIDEMREAEDTERFDFIVDGMLGTGLESELRGNYPQAVHLANESGLPVYAIDIPTGLNSDTGRIMGSAIQASATFTFGTLKQGSYLEKGPELCGKICYCELPFPNYLKACRNFLLDRTWVGEPKKKPARHKYEAGVLYLLAGSEGLTGAAIMAAQSAWAEGIGAVILVCPRGTLPVYEKTLPQIIKKPVGDSGDDCFTAAHLNRASAILGEREGTVLFGPGIGRSEETRAFASGLFESYQGDLLIDADALWCLAEDHNLEQVASRNGETFLTPHPGELSGLAPTKFHDESERLETVRNLSHTHGVTVVSKGYPTIIGTSEGKCFLTGYDTRVFARAGFGDVLAGKIGAYWARGYSADESSAFALLDGYEKINSIAHGFPEPNDLL